MSAPQHPNPKSHPNQPNQHPTPKQHPHPPPHPPATTAAVDTHTHKEKEKEVPHPDTHPPSSQPSPAHRHSHDHDAHHPPSGPLAGLHPLKHVDQLLLQQTPASHQYNAMSTFQISSGDGSRLFSVVDSSGDPKNYSFKVLNEGQVEVVVIHGHKDLVQLKSGSSGAGVAVAFGFGSIIAEKPKGLFARCFQNTKYLLNEEGDEKTTTPELTIMEDDTSSCICCGGGGANATYTILSRKGSPIGRIARKGSRLEEDTEADTFGATFPADLSTGKKALILGMIVVLGVRYFENKIMYRN